MPLGAHRPAVGVVVELDQSWPHQMNIGCPVLRINRIVTRRLCGHDSGGPRDERAQSNERMRSPISPPPARKSCSCRGVFNAPSSLAQAELSEPRGARSEPIMLNCLASVNVPGRSVGCRNYVADADSEMCATSAWARATKQSSPDTRSQLSVPVSTRSNSSKMHGEKPNCNYSALRWKPD